MFGERRRGWHAWLWWFVTALLCAAVRRYSHVDYGAFWKAHWWQADHLGGEPVALLRDALFPMIFAEWGLPHTLQAYPSRSKACRFSLLQDAQRPQGEDLFKPAGTANCCPIPLSSKPYSFVFSLESFSRMNASISGALARIRSHCSL